MDPDVVWRCLFGLALLLVVGCEDEGRPWTPPADGPVTWDADIRPLMVRYCVSCHGVPAQFNAPTHFRLDEYDTRDGVAGAQAAAVRIRARVFLQRTMPPGEPMPLRDRQAVDRWVRDGAPR